MFKLVVFASDSLKTYYNKGEIKERYFNPDNYFDEVHFISLNNEEIEEEKVQQLVGRAKLKIHAVGKWNPWPAPNISRIFLQRKILKIVRDIDPTAIRAYDPLLPGYLAVYCGKKLNVPAIISLHADFDEEREYTKQFGLLKYYKFWFYSKMFEKDALQCADKVMCVTEFLTNYAKKYGVNSGKIEVIYNRVDTERFRRGDRLNNEPVKILCVGRQNKQKNQQCLIRAIKDLPVELLLIGDGEEHENLQLLVEGLNLKNKVKFIKSVPHSEIHKYYAESDIFAIATDHEGMCILLVEAMASSLPVVVTNKEPLPEVVQDAGILVSREPESFTEAFKELIESPELRMQLGNSGRIRSMDFDSRVIEKKEAKMYDEVINKVSNQITTLLGDTRWLHEERMNYLTNKVKQIKNELKHPITLLDVGCGDGIVTSYIASVLNKEDQLVGVDYDEVRLKRLASKLDMKIINGDVTKLPLPDNYADVINIHHVLEHVPDEKNALLELRRVLKPGGYLIIGVPHEGGIMGKILRTVHWKMYNKAKNLKHGWHVNFYSRKNMTKKLKDAGMNVVEIKGVGAIFPFYPIHYFILRRRALFRIGNWKAQIFKSLSDSLFFIVQK
jgi:glycosyltransferase involved in cell wall biosynthesis